MKDKEPTMGQIYDAPTDTSGPYDALPQEGEPSPFRALTFSELMQKPDKEWLVENVIGVGDLGMLWGAPGSGKTFVALDLIMACVCEIEGVQWGDSFQVMRPLKIAYCASEGHGGLKARFAAAVQRWNIPEAVINERLRIFEDAPQLYNNKSLHNAESFGRHFEESTGWGGCDLLILDTFHGCTYGANENDAQDAGVILGDAKAIQRELDCAIFFVHHANKSNTAERGSSAFKGALDIQIQVSEDGDGVHKMTCTKAKDAEMFKPHIFVLWPQGQSCSIDWRGTTRPDGRETETGNHVLAALEEEPNRWYEAKALTEAMGYDVDERKNVSAVRRALNGLAKDGRVESRPNAPAKPVGRYNPLVYRLLSGDS